MPCTASKTRRDVRLLDGHGARRGAVRAARAAALAAWILAPALALGHGAEEHAGTGARTSAVIQAIALGAIALAAALYGLGLRRLWREAGTGQGIRRVEAFAYGGGLVAMAVALAPPLDRASVELFSAHMAQHQLLLLVAPPLLVAGRPHVAALFALSGGARAGAAAIVRRPALRRVWGALTAPLAAAVLHAVAVWGWHVPRLWDAALLDPRLHAVQHVTFFGTAVLFWWAMLQGRFGRAGYGVAVLYVFATAVHTSLLGALLAYAHTVWYPSNASGADPAAALGDQQLGGLVMWIPSGALLTLLGVGLFAAWLGELERRGGGARSASAPGSDGARR